MAVDLFMEEYKKAIDLMFPKVISLENKRSIACGYGARRECCAIKPRLKIVFECQLMIVCLSA